MNVGAIDGGAVPDAELDLPSGWRRVRLKDVTVEGTERNRDGEFDRTDVLGVDNQDGLGPSDRLLGDDFSRYKLVRRHQFAYNPMRLNVGSIGLWASDQTAIVSPDYIVFGCREDQLDPDFMDLFRRSAGWNAQIRQSGQGSVRIRYYYRHIGEFLVPLPPVAEQRSIACILRTVQRSIHATDQVLTELRELKQSFLQHLFTYGPVPFSQVGQVELKATDAGSIPEHWSTVKLGDVIREPLRNGHSAPASESGSGIRTLTLTAVTQNDFSVKNTKVTTATAEKARGLWLRSGDIFIERANTPEYVGLAALYNGPDDYAIFPDLLVRVRVDTERVMPEYLATFLLTEPCRRYYRKNAKATTGNFPKIDQGVIENTQVHLPPMDEQEEIVRLVRSLDAKRWPEENRRQALDELFQSLLHQLLTGQVRVPDAAPAPEIV